MTYAVKVEAIEFTGLSIEEAQQKLKALKSIGIKKHYIVEDESNAELTTGFQDKEAQLRKQLDKKLTDAKRHLNLEYNNAVKVALEEYYSEKDKLVAQVLGETATP
jgi:hypothetical protein